MNRKERLKMAYQYLRSKGYVHTHLEFANKIGYNKSNVSSAFSGNERYLTDEFLSAICKVFSELNEEWLLSEKGKMLKNQSNSVSGDNYGIGNIGLISGGHNTYNVSENSTEKDTDVYSANQRGIGVPYFDVDFTMGFDLIENDQTVNPEYHIDFPQYNKADCWVNATGKSMSPLIDHGDKIALKRVLNWEDNILYGEIYAVVTEEYRTIKKIRRSLKGDDYLRFIPENTNGYDEHDVHKQTILSLYRVLGCAKLLY